MSVIPTDDWYRDLVAAVERQQRGLTDQIGRPWAQHFQRTAIRLVFRNPRASRAQIEAALLHDAFMARGGGIEMLASMGVSEEAIDIIRITTPPPNADFFRVFEDITAADTQVYMDYVNSLVATGHRGAIAMKLADIQDTIDSCRAGATPILVREFRTRYEPSRRILEQALSPDMV